MDAMVLCAGFGTRLRPLTDRVPKPLVPLCGVPLLRYNLALLRQAGVGRVVINTHHLAAEMERGAQAEAERLGLPLFVSREEKQILGTGGGIRKAAQFLSGGTFVVLNGDMLFDLDVAAAVAAHREARAMATMVLAPYPKGATYGAVEVDAQARVRRVAGRGASPEPGLVKMHFTGVHVLEPEVLARLPEGESDINRVGYVRLIHEGVRVLGWEQHGTWADLGAPRALLRSNLDVLAGRVSLARFRAGGADPWSDAQERAPGIWVAPGAVLEEGAIASAPLLVHAGARVAAGAVVGPEVVLGQDVRVDAGARVERAVCWDGTHVGPGERVAECVAAPGVRLDAA